MPDETNRTALFVYAGTRRRFGEKKVTTQLYRIKDDGKLGESFAFVPSTREARSAFSVLGGVYRVELHADEARSSIFPSTAVLVERWNDGTDLLTWKAEHDAVRLHTKTAALEPADEQLLKQLRLAYNRVAGPAKGVFLARVVDYIIH